MSRQLDPDRPLWEMHVVEGLEGERTALVAKVHHAILDGVSGASVLAAFLDLTPRTRIVELPPEWDPAPLPSNTQMLRHAASSLARQPGSTLSTLQAGVEAVADLGMHNRELAGRGEQSPPGFFAAPRTSFNGAVSNRKRFAGLSVPLEDVKLVGRVYEATVNDVILACVSGGLRRLLDARGERAEGPLVAMVPVSTRSDGETEELGNQISGMLVSLASDIDDPVARLDAISESARVAKEQEKLHGGRFLGDLAQIALPALASRVARAVAGTRLFDKMRPPFNVTISSVRVPDVPLFLAGSRVAGTYPVGPMAEGIGLNVTAFSYLGRVYFGMLALPPPPAGARRSGGARRRCPRRAGGVRPRCPGGDGVALGVAPGPRTPRGGGADRVEDPAHTARSSVVGWGYAAEADAPDVDPLLEPDVGGAPDPDGGVPLSEPEPLPMFGQFLVEPEPEPELGSASSSRSCCCSSPTRVSWWTSPTTSSCRSSPRWTWSLRWRPAHPRRGARR